MYRVERADSSRGGGLGHAPVKNDLSPPSPHSHPPLGLVVNPHSCLYSGLFALMISAACGCVTLGAVPLAPASGSARRCLFVCEFDPTDRSSLVRPIRQQTIAKTSVS